jgi:uncharacterized protein
MVFIDTGYLLALAKPDDALNERALRWSQQLYEPLLVTEYVLWETVNALSRRELRRPPQCLVDVVQISPRYALISATQELFDSGMRLHAERTLTDCISFLVMAKRGVIRALAFDEHFEQAGFVALLRADPS